MPVRVLLLGLVLLCSRVVPSAAAELAGSRPNIILVMTDDEGIGDLHCLGNPIVRTPHIDKLYTQSTRFTDFHVSPTCSPTRSSIMTGRHEFQNGVTHTILERERMTLDAQTLPQALQAAGYATGIFGKWHLGDEELYQPQHRGFDEVFIHGAGGIGQAYDCSCADAPPNKEHPYFDSVIRHNGKFVQTHGFCTDTFFQAALGWIKSRKDTDQPFFAYLATNAPHGPMIAPPASKQRFLDDGWDEDSAGRLGMIENIDDNMGLMLAKLDEWKLVDNTLLIFMTDNGQAMRAGKKNGKRESLDFSGFKTGKGSPFEGGTHVPAFWRWTGTLPAGRDIKGLAAAIDLFPTFAALTGAKLPPHNQVKGRSLLPLLASDHAEWPDRQLFVHVGRWAKGDDPNGSKFKNCAVRTQRFRLVNNKELYDIQADPFETTNVIDQHPDEVAAIRKAYDAWWAETVPLMVNEGVPNADSRPFWVWYEQEKIQPGGIPEWRPPQL